MSRTLKVHRKKYKGRVIELKYSIMMCGMEIPITDFNYHGRVANMNDRVTCGNCKRIMVR